MTALEVYLERNDFGGFIAHVLDLPGCFSRGDDEENALAALHTSVGNYLQDLERYGEPLP